MGLGPGQRAPLPGANPDGALYGMTVSLAGKLTSMIGDEAFHKLAEVGARSAENVTKKTTVFVSASQAQLKPGDTLSGKDKTAQALLEAGGTSKSSMTTSSCDVRTADACGALTEGSDSRTPSSLSRGSNRCEPTASPGEPLKTGTQAAGVSHFRAAQHLRG